MARKPRIESRDGLYHVINRGNYRRYVFNSTKTKRAFESTIIEACEKSGWWLYAYVVMDNHYRGAEGVRLRILWLTGGCKGLGIRINGAQTKD